jgi:hypothetical protein
MGASLVGPSYIGMDSVQQAAVNDHVLAQTQKHEEQNPSLSPQQVKDFQQKLYNEVTGTPPGREYTDDGQAFRRNDQETKDRVEAITKEYVAKLQLKPLQKETILTVPNSVDSKIRDGKYAGI